MLTMLIGGAWQEGKLIRLAYAFEQAQVDASDISADALAVAEINRRDHGLEERLDCARLPQGDRWSHH